VSPGINAKKGKTATAVMLRMQPTHSQREQQQQFHCNGNIHDKKVKTSSTARMHHTLSVCDKLRHATISTAKTGVAHQQQQQHQRQQCQVTPQTPVSNSKHTQLVSWQN
jgi:hypothetical protein